MHKTLLPPETEASRIANAQKIVLEVGIPSQPRALIDIRRLASNPDVDFEQICDIVRNDPMLSTNTLRLAASPLFGGTRVFESVSQSLMVLGFQHFKRCVLSAIVEKTLSSNSYSMDRFWVHSTAVAALCQKVCERFVPEMADSAYQAGLLHDVGTLVLHKFNDQYTAPLIRHSPSTSAIWWRNTPVMGPIMGLSVCFSARSGKCHARSVRSWPITMSPTTPATQASRSVS